MLEGVSDGELAALVLYRQWDHAIHHTKKEVQWVAVETSRWSTADDCKVSPCKKKQHTHNNGC